MKDVLERSIKDVFEQNFNMELDKCKSKPKGKGLTADIVFIKGNIDFNISLWIQKRTIKEVSALLLFDDSPDDDILKDLVLELTNLIAGHAKMLESDKGVACRIETPIFKGESTLKRKTETILFKRKGCCIGIQIERING